MQVLYRFLHIIKFLILGFYNEGLKILVKLVLERWISILIILSILIYLCSNKTTYFYAWIIIGLFAFLAVIKAIYEIILLLIKYKHTNKIEEKNKIIILIGGKIFDIALSAIGIFQAGKIIRHSIKIAHAAGSAFSLVDDVAATISNITKNFFK